MEKPVEHLHLKKKADLAGTVSVPLVSGNAGQPRMLLQGSGKDQEQLSVPGRGCTKGLQPGWGERSVTPSCPSISLGERMLAFLFSWSNTISTCFFWRRGKSPILPLLSLFLPRLWRLFFPCCSYQFPGSTLLRWSDTCLMLVLENPFNRKIPFQLAMTHSLRVLVLSPRVTRLILQWRVMEMCLSRMQLLLQPVLCLLWYWSVPLKCPVWRFPRESSHTSIPSDLLNNLNYVKKKYLCKCLKSSCCGILDLNYFIGSGSC